MAMIGGCRGDLSNEQREHVLPPPKPKPRPKPLRERIDQALTGAATYLRRHQAADGSFRSTTYSAFKDGYSLTPLIAAALFGIRRNNANVKTMYRRAVDYVATMVNAAGAVDKAALNYPVYALSLGILVLNSPGNQRHRRARDALIGELRRREHNGWGYATGGPNLSATVFASGALLLAGTKRTDKTLKSALVFVLRCQNVNGDGGFFFSPVVADGNKAGKAKDGSFRSYGSMTADGLRALLQLGLRPDHPRVKAASAWLVREFRADKNPGAFGEHNEIRRRSAYFYYAWSVAHAMRALGKRKQSIALAEALLARQRKNGSWKNDYSEMREDDPFVATAFAMAALSVTRIVVTGEYRTHRAVR